MLNRVIEEIRKSPLQVIFGGVSALVGAVTLLLSRSVATGGVDSPTQPSASHISAYLMALAAMITISSAGATVARLLRAISWPAGVFGSICTGVVSIFLITLVVRTQGVRFGPIAEQPNTSHWIIYWGVVAVYAVINGQRTLEDIMRFDRLIKSDGEEGGTSVVGILCTLSPWLIAVYYGGQMLAGGLLG